MFSELFFYLGWFGGEKTEKIGDFTTKMYSMSGLDYCVTVRRRETRAIPGKSLGVTA